MKVTIEMLQAKDACREQVGIFVKEWPDGCSTSLKNLTRAVQLGLDLEWFACNFLTAPALAEYEKVTAQAWAEYEKVMAPAWAEYEKVMAQALAEYEKVMAQALAEYKKVKAPAWAEYEKVKAPAWAEYKKVKAQALHRALLQRMGRME